MGVVLPNVSPKTEKAWLWSKLRSDLVNTKLTNHQLDMGHVSFREGTGIVSTVSQCSSQDFDGGVPVLQFVLEVKDSLAKLQVLTFPSFIVVRTSVVQKHLLRPVLHLLPIKNLRLDVLPAADLAWQNSCTALWHSHQDRVNSWKGESRTKEENRKEEWRRVMKKTFLTFSV